MFSNTIKRATSKGLFPAKVVNLKAKQNCLSIMPTLRPFSNFNQTGFRASFALNKPMS